MTIHVPAWVLFNWHGVYLFLVVGWPIAVATGLIAGWRRRDR